MIKKLVATFTGASSIFGFSIGKHLNLFSSDSLENLSSKSKNSSAWGGH
ncbi:hypothetical protein MSUIS_04860 [Mycoplasma suis KI3806]|uniref:Uncharacterized protein n=1 Tax=Mycoplasma suis (strain KI_3806) TaxID=708248 RepID=F0V1P8_MYCS3|nr:hypothetical protein [Mycoplasma suis]CBZ40579.1 hypothetical protein MSUIS_04860 [Mycoplasma suis KI3806]